MCRMFWIRCLVFVSNIFTIVRFSILYLYTSLIYAFHIHFFVKVFSMWPYKCFYVIIRHIIIYIRVVPFFDSTSYVREKCKWNSHEKIWIDGPFLTKQISYSIIYTNRFQVFGHLLKKQKRKVRYIFETCLDVRK